jgi:hypothetical protein
MEIKIRGFLYLTNSLLVITVLLNNERKSRRIILSRTSRLSQIQDYSLLFYLESWTWIEILREGVCWSWVSDSGWLPPNRPQSLRTHLLRILETLSALLVGKGSRDSLPRGTIYVSDGRWWVQHGYTKIVLLERFHRHRVPSAAWVLHRLATSDCCPLCSSNRWNGIDVCLS